MDEEIKGKPFSRDWVSFVLRAIVVGVVLMCITSFNMDFRAMRKDIAETTRTLNSILISNKWVIETLSKIGDDFSSLNNRVIDNSLRIRTAESEIRNLKASRKR